MNRLRTLLAVSVVLILGLSHHAMAVPVLLYDAGEGSGTGPAITDLSGAGNHGTVKSDGALPTAAGPFTGTTAYDVTGDGINTDNTQLLNNPDILTHGGYVMEAWFRYDTEADDNDNATIVSYAGTDQLVLNSGTGELIFQTQSVGAATNVISSTTVQKGVWYHAVGEFIDVSASGTSVDGTMRLTVTELGGTPTVDSLSATKTDFGDGLDRAIGIGDHPVGFPGTDFAGLIYNPSVAFIPEPASLAFLGLGGLLMLRRRGAKV